MKDVEKALKQLAEAVKNDETVSSVKVVIILKKPKDNKATTTKKAK